jgi:hypothetical protein
MYMFCPYVMHVYPLLEELQMRTFKRYLFSHNSSHNFTPKRYELSVFTTVFCRELASCCSRKIEKYVQHRNTSSSRVSSAKRPLDEFPTEFLPNLVRSQKEVSS